MVSRVRTLPLSASIAIAAAGGAIAIAPVLMGLASSGVRGMILWGAAALAVTNIAGLVHELAHARAARQEDPSRTYTIDLGLPLSARAWTTRSGIRVRPGRPAGFMWGFWVDGEMADTDAVGMRRVLEAGPRADFKTALVGTAALAAAVGLGAGDVARVSALVAGVGWHMLGLDLGRWDGRADGYWLARLRADPAAVLDLRARALARYADAKYRYEEKEEDQDESRR